VTATYEVGNETECKCQISIYSKIEGKPGNPSQNWASRNLLWIIFKNSVPISQETKSVAIINADLLIIFKEIIVAYSENRIKYMNTLAWEAAEVFYIKEFFP
jgi:hypothetical protein